MNVYVIYDPLYECVIGARSTEELAEQLCKELNDKYRPGEFIYPYEWEKLEIDGGLINLP